MADRRKWPFRVTLLACLIAIFALWNLVRLVTSIAWHDTLQTYAPHPGPFYIGITGAIWMLVGVFLLWCLWRGKRWTRRIFVISTGVYTAWFWLDRLLIQAEIRSNWLFSLIANILLLAFIGAVILDHHNLIYLEREAYERES